MNRPGYGEVECLYCGHLIPVGPRVIVMGARTGKDQVGPTKRHGSMHAECWERVSLDLAGLRGVRARQGVSNQAGQTVIEYALIMALVAIPLIVAIGG